MKLSKRFRILAVALGGGIVVASSACSVDSLDRATSPTGLAPSVANAYRGHSGSPFAASEVSTFNVSVDPLTGATLNFGSSQLVLPPNAICEIGTSSYGPEFWNAPCDPQTTPVQLTISVRTTSKGTSVDFSPNLRFNPLTNVQLTLSAPDVRKQDAKQWVILYCASGSSGKGGKRCVNEARTDEDLQTFIDYDLQQLSRRIKHFSRYQVDDSSGFLASE